MSEKGNVRIHNNVISLPYNCTACYDHCLHLPFHWTNNATSNLFKKINQNSKVLNNVSKYSQAVMCKCM